MANVFIQDSTMAAIGEAIREKTGGVALIYPKDMAAQISSIKTGAVLQEKTVTPTTSQQEVTPDAEYDGLSKVTVEAMQVSDTASPVIEVSDEGLIQASVQHNEGYVAADETTTSTKQLPTQAAKAVTPATNEQVAVEAGVFTTGAVIVVGDANLVPENIKSGVSIFGVDGTHEGGIDVTLIEGMEIALDFSAGDQSLAAPDGQAVKTATIKKPTTLVPQNISNGVNIAGVVGTLESGSGDGSDLVRYVTFLDEDGSELFKMPVLVGDDCKDPVTHGDISKPTKESTNTQVFTYSGWTSTVGGTADADILKNITEDKTVYVAYAVSVRYYTINFYDGETLLKTVEATYGQDLSSYVPEKLGYDLDGWNPPVNNITSEFDTYAVWVESTKDDWDRLHDSIVDGTYKTKYSGGKVFPLTVTDADGNYQTVNMILADFDHDVESDGNVAAISFLCKEVIYLGEISSDGWGSSEMRTFCNGAFFESLPANVREYIKPVSKTSCNYKGEVNTTVDSVWVVAGTEIGLSYSPGGDGENYTWSGSNKKYKPTISIRASAWNTRSLRKTTNSYDACIIGVNTSGNRSYFNDDNGYPAAFGFCF